MLVLALLFAVAFPADLEKARNDQSKAELARISAELAGTAAKQASDPAPHYQAALAKSYLAEVALELKDNGEAKTAAEAGIKLAERAVELKPENAEYHRVLGTLCGQVIPANVLSGLRHGQCALQSISKAIELDGKSALAHMSRGVGNFYLPPAFGGGVDQAIKDLQRATALNPKLAEAHMWLGIALRKAGRNAEARASLARAVELNPHRIWAKKQLEKTPGK